MATNTPNYQLRKPDPGDTVNVTTDISDSMDTIDTELKAVSDVADGAAAHGVWQTYAPTWASGSNPQPAIGNGTLVARYVQIGKWVHLRLRLIAGATTTFGTGDWSFSLPVNSVNLANVESFGPCVTLDAGTAYKLDAANIASNASIMRIINIAAGSFYNPTSPMAWANTDFLNISITYQAA